MFGVGIDIVSIKEFDRLVQDEVTSFTSRHFTSREIEYSKAESHSRPAEHLAVRYAAKEAALKALEQARGTRHPPLSNINYLDMEVSLDDGGRPTLNFTGEVAKLLKEIGVKKTFLSLSHDGDYAVAVLVLEG